MERLIVVFNALEKKMDRRVKDLSDTRTSMETLRDIRDQECDFDLSIDLVEVRIILFWRVAKSIS